MVGAHFAEQLRAKIAVSLVALLSSATPSARLVVPGPTIIAVFGVDFPVLSALFALAGVVLGQLLAPPPKLPLGWRRQSALVVALLGLAIGIVIATGQLPLIALSWGIGLGFSGLTVAQVLGEQASLGIRRVSDAFITMLTTRVGGEDSGKNTSKDDTHA